MERISDSSFTLGTYIAFRNLGNRWGGKDHKTNEYEVTEKHNVRATLGYIRWFARWRKYAFSPITNTVFEETCLREIAQFVEEETQAHRAKTRKV